LLIFVAGQIRKAEFIRVLILTIIMEIKRPQKWKIEIWEEDGVWKEEYIELFSITPENIEALGVTLPIIEQILKKSGFSEATVEKVEMDEMVGIKIITTSKDLVPIANQLLSEFVLMSEIGDITLKDVFMFAIQSLL